MLAMSADAGAAESAVPRTPPAAGSGADSHLATVVRGAEGRAESEGEGEGENAQAQPAVYAEHTHLPPPRWTAETLVDLEVARDQAGFDADAWRQEQQRALNGRVAAWNQEVNDQLASSSQASTDSAAPVPARSAITQQQLEAYDAWLMTVATARPPHTPHAARARPPSPSPRTQSVHPHRTTTTTTTTATATTVAGQPARARCVWRRGVLRRV